MSGDRKEKVSKPWEFTTRFDQTGYPRVFPVQAAHYPSHQEFDEIEGLTVAPPPSRETSPVRATEDENGVPFRRLSLTTRQIVNRMTMLEAFSDAISRTYRPHAETHNKPAPDPDATFAEYIPFPFDFDIVPDPKATKHGYIQKGVDYLYYLCPVALVLTGILFSMTLFAVRFLKEVYAKKMLRTILLECTYVNVIGFIVAHLTLILLLLIFLSYPHRAEWGRFHKMRWILVGMTNMILVVGVMDQFYWVTHFGDLGHHLKENMGEGLDVTKQTILSHTTQVYFSCCGLDGHEDWTHILRNNRSLYYGGYPETCCGNTYIKACSFPIRAQIMKPGDRMAFNQLWPTGCYQHEAFLLHVTICLIWIVILAIAVTSILETLFLWWIIRHVNILDLKVLHPFRD